MSLLPNLEQMTDNEKLAVLESIQKSIAESKEIQKKKIGENVDLVVQALKKIESDIRDRFDSVGNSIEKRVLSIKDGRDGSNGKDGRDGKDGKSGKDGLKGDRGIDGQAGRDGVDGVDGISVVNANIDFDGSLIISLSDGREINVGEVVSADVAEKIKVISTMSTNGAVGIKDEGTSISTGVKTINFVGAAVTATNSGDDVTVNVSSGTGTVTSVAATGGTGISISGSPITTTGTLTITNTAPDQTVVLTAGTGINTSGTYPSFTIANSAPDQTVVLTAGTGISTSGTYPNFTITNSAPDQTVALTQGGTTTITGTYPNFTISSADQFQGTVTSVIGTSPVASSGGATPAISLAANYGDTQNPYASKTANFVLAAPNGSAGVPTFRAVVAADIPTLNQNTTGSAATVTTTINSGVVATTQTAGDNSTKVATTAYVNSITGTNGITGFKNRLINGAMAIWQRATSQTFTNSLVYGSVDRWVFIQGGGSASIAQTQSTSVPTGFQYAIKQQRTAASTTTGTVYSVQEIETVNCYDLAGQAVTLSFWAKCGANFSASGSTLTSLIYQGTGVDQGTTSWISGTWTSPTSSTQSNTLTTSYQKFTQTVTLGASTTELVIALQWVPVGTAGADDSVFITGVQLEKGSTATSFDYRPYGTELALCQRYFVGTGFGNMGICTNTTTSWNMSHTFPVAMRASPTLISYSGTFGTTNAMTDAYVQDYILTTAVGSINNAGPTGARTSGWTTNNAGAGGRIAMWNSTTAVIQFSAEL